MKNYKQNLKSMLLEPSKYMTRRDDIDFEKLKSYAIVDSAVERMIIGHFASDEPEYWILYKGDTARDLEIVAPYLVRLDASNEFTQRVIEDGYGKNWGCFIFSEYAGDELAEHLRQYTEIYDSELEQNIYIRFYDPRAINKYFRCFKEQESEDFFEKIKIIMVNKIDELKKIDYYSLSTDSVVMQGDILLNNLEPMDKNNERV